MTNVIKLKKPHVAHAAFLEIPIVKQLFISILPLLSSSYRT